MILLIAGEYLAAHEVGTGGFLVLAAKAPSSVRKVTVHLGPLQYVTSRNALRRTLVNGLGRGE